MPQLQGALRVSANTLSSSTLVPLIICQCGRPCCVRSYFTNAYSWVLEASATNTLPSIVVPSSCLPASLPAAAYKVEAREKNKKKAEATKKRKAGKELEEAGEEGETAGVVKGRVFYGAPGPQYP